MGVLVLALLFPVVLYGASLAVATNVCYIRGVHSAAEVQVGDPTGLDPESRMAADIAAATLQFASDDDSRLITWESTDGERNAAAQIVATKLYTCSQAGKKLLLNQHAGGDGYRFLRRVVRDYWIACRGVGVDQPLPNGAVTPRAKINIASCKPQDFGVYDVLRRDYLTDAGIPPNRRAEYCEFLIGARCGGGAHALLEADYLARKAVADNNNAALAAGLVQTAATAAQQLAAGLPAAAVDQIVRWPANAVAAGISNVLLDRIEGGFDRMRMIVHPAFVHHDTDTNGGQRKHHIAKDACYAQYQYDEANTDLAYTVSSCIRGVVYDVSSSAADRALVGTAGYTTPVFVSQVVDVAMAAQPHILTVAQAWPDLAGCEKSADHAFTTRRRAKVLSKKKEKKKGDDKRPRFEPMPNVLMQTKGGTNSKLERIRVSRKTKARKLRTAGDRRI